MVRDEKRAPQVIHSGKRKRKIDKRMDWIF